MGQGISESTVSMMFLAKVAGTPQLRKSIQSCEKVSSGSGPTTLGQGFPWVRVARMSQAKRPGPPRARQLGAQSFEDVSSETARTTRVL